MFLPNAHESGYYRSLLSVAELVKIAKSGFADERERVGLVGNSWALVQSGKLGASEWLTFVETFANETSPHVWEEIESAIGEQRMFLGEEATFQKRVAKLFLPTSRRLGYQPAPGEREETQLLRHIAVRALGDLGHDAGVRAEALRQTDRWLADANSVDADLAAIFLPLAARDGKTALFDRLLAAYDGAPTPERQVTALEGLSGFEDAALVNRLLDLVVSGKIKAHQLRYVFPALYERPETARITYAYEREHFDAVVKILPGFVVGRLPWVIASLCDEAQVLEASAFFRPRLQKIEGADKSLDQAVDAGKLCAALAKHERKSRGKP